MKTNNILSILAIGSLMTLSGCAESQIMGNTVGKGAMRLVDSFATGVQQGIDRNFPNSSNQTIATPNLIRTTTVTPTKASNTITSEDMVYLFGWMEDACSGENPSRDGIKQDERTFLESFYSSNGYDNYFVKPRAQWLAEYRNMIKDIKYTDDSSINVGGHEGEYKVIFKEGVKYRGQSVESYTYTFIKESAGDVHTLKFAPNANITAIWPNFKTRNIEYWGEIEDIGAVYKPQDRTIQCYLT